MIFKSKTVPEIDMENVNLLIADDHVDTANMLLYKTKMCGWTGTAVNSASGIIDAMNDASLQGQDFDGIIADVNFFDNQPGPRVTGITAIREVRKVRPNIPVIFVTGFSNTLLREEVRRVNADLMAKPVDIDALFERVYNLIYWHRLSLLPYQGKERRGSSVNMTDLRRRAGDVKVGRPSPIITTVLNEVRDEALRKKQSRH